MEKKPKKSWQKPELIILVRSNPEEAVLLSCKHGGGGGPMKSNCKEMTGPGDCSAIAKS